MKNIKPKLKDNSKDFHLCVLDFMLCYAKSLQSCPTLCDPIDGSPPGSVIPGILQARIPEWVAISFSSAWKEKSESEVSQSCPTLSNSMDCSLPGSSIQGIFQARVLEWGAIAFSRKSLLVMNTRKHLRLQYFVIIAFSIWYRRAAPSPFTPRLTSLRRRECKADRNPVPEDWVPLSLLGCTNTTKANSKFPPVFFTY